MTKTMTFYRLFLCLICTFLFIRCDDNKDEYFDRPDWLDPPIYEVLQKEGRFGYYLQCVDRTEYANVLKGAALYTVFAPNDDAFALWLQESPYASVSEIPDDIVEKIVAYSIVYSKWEASRLAYRLTGGSYSADPEAFKRKTVNYTLPYRDDEISNEWVFDETTRGSISFTTVDYQLQLRQQNYKYLPIYTSEYFNLKKLTEEDYNTFYPNAVFTGKNVQEGSIIKADILAENGIIHEVSRVNIPMDNIEKALKSDPLYSSYYGLLNYKTALNEYAFKSYIDASSFSTNQILEVFQKMLPFENITKIYIKCYPPTMGFSPVMENIFSDDDGSNISEISGNTLFVPENGALDSYIQEKILKYYANIKDVPETVLFTLINTHMATGLIWPSLYKESFNYTGEYLNGVGSGGNDFAGAGVLGKQMASNGFIYRINHVIKSRYFETVYSEVYLNPARTLINTAYSDNLREELMKSPLNGYNSERWTLLNISDNLLTEDGFGYDDLNSEFTHKESGNITGGVTSRLQRLINMHIFPGLKNNTINSEITDFSVSPHGSVIYDGWGFLVNYNGDMIRYKNNRLQAAGNIEDGSYVTVAKQTGEFNNGLVFSVDNLLQYSPRVTKAGLTDAYTDLPLWKYLDRARTENSNVKDFVDYVEVCLKKLDSEELSGIKPELFYTVLMPNNSAMTLARNAGYLPALSSLKDPNTETNPDYVKHMAQATLFLNAHFLQGQVFADDGLEYIYPVQAMSPNESKPSTLLKITDEKWDLVNQSTIVKVSKVLQNGSWVLKFEPQDIKRGNEIMVKAGVGNGTLTSITGVNRNKVSATAQNNYRSNRIACKAVLHEISSFMRFTVQD